MSRSTEMSPASTRTLRIAGWSLAAVLLALPAVAMQFSDGVNWTAGDFVFAAIIFGTVGGLMELAARASANLSFRLGAALGLIAAFLIVWINAAVGIVGDSDNPLNLVYIAVLAVAAASAVTAWPNARRLTRAMRATAVVQGLICLAHVFDAIHPAALIDGFFTLIWLASSMFFARAATMHLDA